VHGVIQVFDERGALVSFRRGGPSFRFRALLAIDQGGWVQDPLEDHQSRGEDHHPGRRISRSRLRFALRLGFHELDHHR
jgi:hypothetical protein